MDNKNTQTVFFSWKSGDDKTRQYIQNSIERACKQVSSGAKSIFLEEDEGVKNTTGAVEIPSTILSKIEKCLVFIADISSIGNYEGIQLHNQNVIFELGYALGKLGQEKLLLVFNRDSGKIRNLPFDFSHRNIIGFSVKNDPEGEKLCSSVQKHILSNLTTPSMRLVDELDDEEITIMRLFKTMGSEKHVLLVRMLGGGHLVCASSDYDQNILRTIKDTQPIEKLEANFDDLANKGYLKKYFGGNGTPNYKLAKPGYNILNEL